MNKSILNTSDLIISIDNSNLNSLLLTLYNNLKSSLFIGEVSTEIASAAVKVQWSVDAAPLVLLAKEAVQNEHVIYAEHSTLNKMSPEDASSLLDLSNTLALEMPSCSIKVLSADNQSTIITAVTITCNLSLEHNQLSINAESISSRKVSDPVVNLIITKKVLPALLNKIKTALSSIHLPRLALPIAELTPMVLRVFPEAIIAVANLYPKKQPDLPTVMPEIPKSGFSILISKEILEKQITEIARNERINIQKRVGVKGLQAWYRLMFTLVNPKLAIKNERISVSFALDGQASAGISSLAVGIETDAIPEPSAELEMLVVHNQVKVMVRQVNRFMIDIKPRGSKIAKFLEAPFLALLDLISQAADSLVRTHIKDINVTAMTLPSMNTSIDNYKFNIYVNRAGIRVEQNQLLISGKLEIEDEK